MVKTNQMKNNILKIAMLLSVFNILIINVNYSQTKKSTEVLSEYFGYLNFKKTYITLPDTVLNLPIRDISPDNSFIQGMFFDKKQKLKVLSDSLEHELFSQNEIEWVGKQEIPRNFIDLLCDNGMVSIARDYRTDYWTPIFYLQGDTIIKNFKEGNEFWFLGKISINSNYESYLIFTKENDTSGLVFARSLFLMNVKDNKIISLAQVAYNLILAGEGPYQFTKASSRGRYCYYGVSHSTVLIENWLGKIKIPKESKLTYYTFDENGYVQVQELKGRKKFFIYKHKHRLFENVR